MRGEFPALCNRRAQLTLHILAKMRPNRGRRAPLLIDHARDGSPGLVCIGVVGIVQLPHIPQQTTNHPLCLISHLALAGVHQVLECLVGTLREWVLSHWHGHRILIVLELLCWVRREGIFGPSRGWRRTCGHHRWLKPSLHPLWHHILKPPAILGGCVVVQTEFRDTWVNLANGLA